MNILRFKQSASEDVLEYRARALQQHVPFSYDAPYSIVFANVDNELVIPRNSFVYVTAADEFNESDPLILEYAMARIGKKTLRFTPSASADAVGYRIYILKDGTEFDYGDVYHEVPDLKDGQKIEVDIGSLSVAPIESGVYDIYVTAIDAFGNESNAMEIQDKTFDFVAPEAPTEGEVI